MFSVLVLFVFVGLVNDEIGYLVEEIFKPSIEGVAWFLLAVYSKMWQEKDKLKSKSLNQMDQNLEVWKSLSLPI